MDRSLLLWGRNFHAPIKKGKGLEKLGDTVKQSVAEETAKNESMVSLPGRKLTLATPCRCWHQKWIALLLMTGFVTERFETGTKCKLKEVRFKWKEVRLKQHSRVCHGYYRGAAIFRLRYNRGDASYGTETRSIKFKHETHHTDTQSERYLLVTQIWTRKISRY